MISAQYTKYHIRYTGFTLIELLVVISIIGILVGLSVFGLQGARKASRDAVRKADLEQIRSGLGMYKADCNTYPLTVVSGSALSGQSSPVLPGCTGNTYITKVPTDSIVDQNYSYSSNGTLYYLCAALEQPPNPTMAGIGNCASCGGASCNYVTTNP